YYDANRKCLGKWGQLGDAQGQIDAQPGVCWGPRAIAVSQSGEVYVTDTGNKRVQVFGLDGSFKRMFGGTGAGPGQFNEEVGLAIDDDGNLWVADTWNTSIKELSSAGEPLARLTIRTDWEMLSV